LLLISVPINNYNLPQTPKIVRRTPSIFLYRYNRILHSPYDVKKRARLICRCIIILWIIIIYVRIAVVVLLLYFTILQYWCLEELAEICEELWKRVYTIEGIKFDLERDIRMKVFEVIILATSVTRTACIQRRSRRRNIFFLSKIPIS